MNHIFWILKLLYFMVVSVPVCGLLLLIIELKDLANKAAFFLSVDSPGVSTLGYFKNFEADEK